MKNELAEQKKVDILVNALKWYHVKGTELIGQNGVYEIDAILSVLGDKYSCYYTSEQMDQIYIPYMKGDISACGLVLMKKDGKTYVDNCISGSEAYQKGVKRNMQLLRVNDEYVVGNSIVETYIMMRKRPTKMLFEFEGIVYSVELLSNNENMECSPAKCSMCSVVEERDWLYINIPSFNEGVEDEVCALLDHYEGDKLIFDLRNNSGGAVGAGMNVLDCILPYNSTLGILKWGEKEEIVKCNNTRKKNWRIALLVNNNTASVAEFFVCAIMDNKGKSFGVCTKGKGLIQTIISFGEIDGTGVKFSIAEMLSKSHIRIENIGICPDVIIDSIDEMIAVKDIVEMVEKGWKWNEGF